MATATPGTLMLAIMALALHAGAACALEVHMAFGDNLPPYIITSTDSGIELDVVREALALRGHVLRAHYFPMGRIAHTFISGQVDAIMMDVGVDMAPYGGHYATPPVLYENVFFTLKRRHLAIHVPNDLNRLTVMSFVGAAARYPLWLAPREHSQLQSERNNQAAQPLLLALGRYDAVLSDRTIFRYYMTEQERVDPSFTAPPVDEHVFTQADPRHYRPVFRSAAIQRDFDAGLAQLRRNGRYQAIYHKYLNN